MLICCAFLRFYVTEPGYLVGKSAGLVIERLRVRILAGAMREFCPPELTLCADSYSVFVPPTCYRSGTKKNSHHSDKVQQAGYI